MSSIDADIMLAQLHWYVGRNVRLRGIVASTRVLRGSDAHPERLSIDFHKLQWSVICNRDGLEIVHADCRQHHRWRDLDPALIDLDPEIGQRALYQDAELLLRVQLQPAGTWQDVLAPGLFILWLWNAALRASGSGGTREA